MINSNFSLILPGLGYNASGDRIIYVFSTAAIGDGAANLLTLLDVQSIDESIVVQNTPSMPSATLQPLEPLSSSTGFGLELSATPKVRSLLDQKGSYYETNGLPILLTTAVSETENVLEVSDESAFSVGDLIIIEREVLEFTGVHSPKHIYVQRGVLGTRAVKHIPLQNELGENAGLLLWQSFPTIVGAKCLIYHHETEDILTHSIITSISSDSSNTLYVSMDSDYTEFTKPFTTRVPLRRDVRVVFDSGAIFTGRPLYLPIIATFQPSLAPSLTTGPHTFLLVGGDLMIVTKAVVSSHGASSYAIRFNQTPISEEESLFWNRESGWTTRGSRTTEFDGEYEIHYCVQFEDEEDLTVENVVKSLLSSTRQSDSSQLAFGAQVESTSLAALSTIGSISNAPNGHLILPPTTGDDVTFGSYLSDNILLPLGIALSVDVTGTTHGIDWELYGSEFTITNEDLASYDFTSTLDTANSLAEVRVSDFLVFRSHRNIAYYAGVGKTLELKTNFISPTFVERRWRSLMKYFEIAPRVFTISVVNNQVAPRFSPGDTILLDISYLPDDSGSVDEHVLDGNVFPLTSLVTSVSGSLSTPAIELTLIARPRIPLVRWAGAVVVDGAQAPSTTISVKSGFYTVSGDDTEKMYLLRDDMVVMLVDQFFTRKSDAAYPVKLLGASPPSSTTIALSLTFRDSSGTSIGADDLDMIIPAPAQEQELGWDDGDEYWFGSSSGEVRGEKPRKYR